MIYETRAERSSAVLRGKVFREESAGCIVFCEDSGERLYLLLYKKASGQYKESWSFPKGWVEKGEEETDTARRETKEEAGISDLQFFPSFKEKIHYVYKREDGMVSKDVIYFLAKTEQKEVTVSYEHSGFEWLAYAEALKRATYKSDKDVLKKAEGYLNKELKSNLSKFF